MIFSTTIFKNDKRWGRLTFDTGKTIVLKPKELTELEHKIEVWQADARLKERMKNNLCLTCGLPAKGDEPCDHIHTGKITE